MRTNSHNPRINGASNCGWQWMKMATFTPSRFTLERKGITEKPALDLDRRWFSPCAISFQLTNHLSSALIISFLQLLWWRILRTKRHSTLVQSSLGESRVSKFQPLLTNHSRTELSKILSLKSIRSQQRGNSNAL